VFHLFYYFVEELKIFFIGTLIYSLNFKHVSSFSVSAVLYYDLIIFLAHLIILSLFEAKKRNGGAFPV
jgi:hypothetical protein